jgi:hypothetical protein
MNRLRKNIGKQFLTKTQISRKKLNKGCEWPLQGELQTSEEQFEEDYRRWKIPHAHGIGRINIVEMAIDNSNPHDQHISHQNANDIHQRLKNLPQSSFGNTKDCE